MKTSRPHMPQKGHKQPDSHPWKKFIVAKQKKRSFNEKESKNKENK
tara:strand:+ start:1830 stop:1967 length:138 start_codon:yes stop_codon:yes gene_type:complete